jgi:hypothetical protein
MARRGTMRRTESLYVPRPSPRRLAWMTSIAVGVDLIAAAFVGSSIVTVPAQAWVAISFVALAVGAAQQETIFGDDTALNGSMIVILAAVGAFVAGAPLWLPTLCGLLGGLSWEHVRERALRKVAVNTACTTIAALAGVGVAKSIDLLVVSHAVGAISGALVAAILYWAVDNSLIALVLTAVDGRPFGAQIRELTWSESWLLPAAVAGFLLGYAAQQGILAVWASVASLIALVAASRVLVFRPPTFVSIRVAARLILLTALTAAVLVTVLLGVHAQLQIAAILAGAVLMIASVVLLERIRPGCGPLAVMVAVVLCDVSFRGTSVAAPTALSLAGCVGVAIARRGALAGVAATCSATFAVAATIALFSADGTKTLGGSVLVGLAIAIAYLVALHAAFAFVLLRRLGAGAWSAAASLLLMDAGVFALGGVLAAAGVWIVRKSSTVGAITFAIVVLVVIVNAAATRRRSRRGQLSDEQLLDVVQSAILKLPASRLPDER